MNNTLVLCQLLNSHVCHEIAGPISAINNSLELMNSANPQIQRDATELNKDATDSLVKKVKFYSYIYSISQNKDPVAFTVIKELCLGYFTNPNVDIDFNTNPISVCIEPELSKALICLIVTAYKNLLKGGLLKVTYQQKSNIIISIKATGEHLFPEPKKMKLLKNLLTGDNKILPTIDNCNEYYINMLNNKMGYKLFITHVNNTIEYSYII